MKTFQILKILNIITSVIILALAVYIVIFPYLPDPAPVSINLDQIAVDNTPQNASLAKVVIPTLLFEPIPKENRLIIPKISVDAPIGETTDSNALGQGMMRIPNTSTPDKGGNTVIIGHRVLFTSGPDTFYDLDKVTVNDLVYVYWKQKEYVYKVYEIKVVKPDQVDIENNTKQSIITLYTCTPKWTSLRRLVVRALLQQ
jgi:LPXTG-site transpeptidase (sortase) family protein